MTIEDPKTFVLVHGMSHGGWCWVRVADRLRALGHKVFTPHIDRRRGAFPSDER